MTPSTISCFSSSVRREKSKRFWRISSAELVTAAMYACISLGELSNSVFRTWTALELASCDEIRHLKQSLQRKNLLRFVGYCQFLYKVCDSCEGFGIIDHGFRYLGLGNLLGIFCAREDVSKKETLGIMEK